MRILNLLGFLIFFVCIISSCSISKNPIRIKLNDIDSAIRIAVPSHNCGCSWQDRKSYISIRPIIKEYSYITQAVYIKSIDSVNVYTDSKKVMQELIKLDSKFAGVKRFFIEYNIILKSDSTKYETAGTWYHFENYCDGYVAGITVKELEKNTMQIIDRKKLCK